VALRAAGVVGAGDPKALLAEAVAVLEAANAPLELARALAELGATHRRAGDRVLAREILRRALDLAQRCGATRTAAVVTAELGIAGARPRRRALSGRDALTPSELRVAQLAAAGHSNREIAQSLFVSLRTVEQHLTKAYAKLELSSRHQLGDALRSEGPPWRPPQAASQRIEPRLESARGSSVR
ncbi:MAG: LuxR C-terminal-related transcriptional regulator, partial [Solirubrobacteraceae bacterium]